MRTYKEPKRIDKPRIRDSAIRQLNDAAKFAAIHSAAVSLREEEEARKREEDERPSGSCENHVIQDFSVEKNIVVNCQTESYKTEVSLTTGTVTITEVANKPFPLSGSSEPKNQTQADDKDSSFSSSLSSIPTDSYISSDGGKLSDLDNSGISTHDPPVSPQRVTENGVDEEGKKSDLEEEEEVPDKKNSKSNLVSVEKKKPSPKPTKKKAASESISKKSPTEKVKKKVNKKSPEGKPVKGKIVKGKKKTSPKAKEITEDSSAFDTSFGDSSKTDESGASVSPRASKRTPKKNRKYHSDEEGQFQHLDDGSPNQKRSPRAVKKRKINFNEDEDDDDFEDERYDFEIDLPEKVEISKPKPPPKKRKKMELNSELGENDTESMVTDDLIPKPKKTKGLKKAKTKIESDVIVPDQTENEKGKDSPPKKKKAVKKKKVENEKANDSVDKESAMNVDKPPKKKRAPKKKLEKNVKSEDVEHGVDDGEDEHEDGAETEVKKEPVLISCPLCGHVSRGKSAYTRHIRRCVDTPRTDNMAGKSSEEGAKVDGAKVNETKVDETKAMEDDIKEESMIEKDSGIDTMVKSSQDKEAKQNEEKEAMDEEEEEEEDDRDHFDSSFDISGDEEETGDKKMDESKPDESGPKKTINIETLLKKQGPDTTFKCEHCEYASPKRAMLGRHLRTHGIYVCLRCNIIYHSKEVLKAHVLQEHKDRADYKLCRKCSRYIRCHEISIEKHMEECTGPVPFKCKYCEKEFKYESSLKSHIIRHDPDAPKRFNCPKCTYKSNYKANLKKHLKNIHDTERVKKGYPCTFENCEKKFFTEDNLKRHLKFHSDVRNFHCPQCPKRFKTSAALRGHVIVHDPARPFKCNINDCTKDFRSKKLLKNHMEEYHNMTDKKFPCDFEGCTFTFFKRSHLQRHKISHTGERKFGCSVCGKAFRHADNLKVHMRQHTNEKPVACELCSFTCRQKSSLQYHLHKFHGIAPKPKKPKKAVVDSSINSSSNDSKPILSSSEFKENQKDSSLVKAENSFDSKVFTPKKRENPMDLYEFRSDEEFDDDSMLMPLRQDKTSTPIRHEKISFLSQASKSSDLLDRTSKSLDFDDDDDKLSDIDTHKDSKEPEDRKKKKTVKKEVKDNMEDGEKPVKTTAKSQKPKKTPGRKKKAKVGETKSQTQSDDEENSKPAKLVEVEEKLIKPKAKRGRKPKPKPESVEPTEAAAEHKEPEKSPAKPPRKKPGPKPKNKPPTAEDTGKTKKKRGPKKKKAPVNEDITEEESNQTQKKKRKYVRKKKAEKQVEDKTKGRKKLEGAESQETEEEDTIIYSELEQHTANEDDGEATEIEGFNDDDDEGDNDKSPGSAKSLGRESPQEDIEKEVELKVEEKEQDLIVEEKEKVEEPMETTKGVKEDEEKRTSEAESDRMSSGIDTDFEDDLKPPPAPRPPPVVESDEGDIESGPEDMDTPGRDFESTPPKSVQNHSVQSLPGRDYESTPRDYESTPPKSVQPDSVPNYGSNENKNDVMSPPSKGYSSVEAVKRDLSIDSQTEDREMSNPVPSNISYPQAGSVELPSSVASNPPQQGSQSNTGYGSQTESAMPEVDKDYLGQYLQQFDSGGRSSDDNSRLNPSVERPPEHINIPASPQDKELPPLNLSSSVPPLNLSTTPDRDSIHTKGADLSNKRMEILTCDRQQEEHFQQRSDNPSRSSERIPENVYEGFPSMNSYLPGSRETPSLFPPTTTGSSYSFSESDSILQRQRMTTPFLTQSDPNALQNLHRMADSALTANNPASLLRRPTTVPSREEIFPPPSAVSQTMARNPFHTSWTSQDVRHPHWSQASYLQRPGASTTNPLFPKENYLSGREFMFDTSRRSVAERNMFPGLPQTQRSDLPHETFPGFEFGYFGGHGYPGAPPLDYTRSSTQTAAQKTFDERYRQSATGMSDFRTLPPSSSSDMFRSMNPSFNLDKYMYGRDPMYHPQHVGDTTNSPFLTPGVPSQHAMFDRDYTRGFYHQNSPYSFMNDKPYAAAAAAASAKLTHPSTPGMGQERDFVTRPNTAAAAAADSQIPMQDPYRHPMLYNMMNRYFES